VGGSTKDDGPGDLLEQWVAEVTNFSSEYGKHAYCHSKVRVCVRVRTLYTVPAHFDVARFFLAVGWS
jgi:hypothetical protein